jgi:hypothetical protein
MDSYAGPARPEWQANPDTCLSSFDVDLTVVVDDAGWHASATFVTPPQGDEREGWSFLMKLGPYFALRLLEDQQATILVRVDEDADGHLLLTAA